MSLPRYPKYKPSGIEWLGDVPEHWEVGRLGYLCKKIGSGKTPLGGSTTYADAGVVFIRSQNVYDDGLRFDDIVFISADVDEDMANSRVHAGDILLNITGASIGRTCLVPNGFTGGNVNQHVCILRLSNADYRGYIALFLKSRLVKGQIDVIQTGAGREGLNYGQISKLAIFAPPLDEQRRIVIFLERETAKIDGLIEEQWRLIELLKEKRQAVISHAVTRGLNPDASLKPSGIEWLGDVPTHWEITKIKHLARSIEQGWSPQCEGVSVQDDAEWGVLKVGCVNGGIFDPSENKLLPPGLDGIPALAIADGDLLVSRANTRELVGSAAVTRKNYSNLMICDKLYRLRFHANRCSANFVSSYLGSVAARGQIELAATGASASMVNIGQPVIMELAIAAPELAEQHGILSFLEVETAKFDALTTEAERAIDLLQERRSALISAAVTGQIDVRNSGGAEA